MMVLAAMHQSGSVHVSTVRGGQHHGRNWGYSGPILDIVGSTRITQGGPQRDSEQFISMADPVLTGTMKVPVERGPADSGVAVESFAPLPRYTATGLLVFARLWTLRPAHEPAPLPARKPRSAPAPFASPDR
jgi:hypothetical protein